MTITNLQMSQIAERAAEHVEHGWCQGKSVVLRYPDGEPEVEAVCLGYAIGLAASEILGQSVDYVNSDRVWFAVQDKITERTDGEFCYVPAWNDAKGRTQQQVIDLALEVSKDYRILADEEGAA